jgi:hypothetical protein
MTLNNFVVRWGSCATHLVIQAVSGKRDDAGSRVQRESVASPVRDEGVRDPAVDFI